MTFNFVSSSPASGASNVPNNQSLVLTFDQTIDATTISAFSQTAGIGGNGGISVSGNTITMLPPSGGWLGSNSVGAFCSTSLMDTLGDALSASVSITFLVAPSFSATGSTPGNGTSSVALNQAVSATFTNSVGALNGGASMTGGASPSISGTNINFGSGPWVKNTTYTVTITTAVTDIYGQNLSSGYSFSFTTIAPTKYTPTLSSNAMGVITDSIGRVIRRRRTVADAPTAADSLKKKAAHIDSESLKSFVVIQA